MRQEGDLALCETLKAIGNLFAKMEGIGWTGQDGEEWAVNFTALSPNDPSLWLKSEKMGGEEERQTKVRTCIQEVWLPTQTTFTTHKFSATNATQ